jgi:hypothetical protein
MKDTTIPGRTGSFTVSQRIAKARGRATKNEFTDRDNTKSFSAEEKNFRGLNKIHVEKMPKPKIRPLETTTFPGSAANNGKLKDMKEEVQAPSLSPIRKPEPKPAPGFKLDNTVKGLRRRMKNSGGHMMLKPQAEAYVAPNTGNSNYAQNLPAPVGSKTNKGKTLVDKRLVIPKKEAYADANRDAGYVAHENVIIKLEDLNPLFEAYVKEELKVGEKQEVDGNNEAKKVRGTNAKGPGTGKVSTVKRKYLGSNRGTTATGKPAHAIDIQPVIGSKDKNWNKTTPSGELKKR